MKTVFDLYHWSHPDAAAEVTYGFESETAAAESVGIPDTSYWERLQHSDGWLIDPDPATGRQTEWGVFERQQAESDAERIELTLDLLGTDGQVDGDHHKAWVIDQAVRILTGDGYDAWVAEHCDGVDGPNTYRWDEGIAP